MQHCLQFLIGSCDFFALPEGLHFAMHCVDLAELTTGSRNCRECSQCVSHYLGAVNNK